MNGECHMALMLVNGLISGTLHGQHNLKSGCLDVHIVDHRCRQLWGVAVEN